MKDIRLEIKSRESIVKMAIDFIRTNIVEDRIKPNEKISMRQISSDLNISTTPIREAVRKLESEGLIILIPRIGFKVKQYNREKIEEIYTVRKILELYAIKLACKKITKKEIIKIKNINNKLSEILSEDKKNILEVKKLNEAFHFTIYQASKNHTICEIIQNLWYRISGLFFQIFANPEQGKTTFKEHQDIIQALEEKNIEKAVQLLDKHLNLNKEILLSYIALNDSK